ncbi:universal stress protein [Natranaeroarchaeum sulfidigenes]|uniref:Nucleotide-binding protein, UspA family n=1 Tax=Natranaeroarchaeum sulfidigenes TaxID=2784880 RepID=A0A897MRD8_9EURY|nr:universal stress protein [Natranaeroarchaeum sulfidigenes]QSG02578.1 Nucleotide-binding protein, UspA family [Natranaeroarchaeum sulfidigenes]
MNDRILLPYDGSDPAKDALQYTLETFPESELHVLYVVPEPEGYWMAFKDDDSDPPGYEKARQRGAELVSEAAETASEHGSDVETEIARGQPEDVIVDRAEREDIETVVIGSHGREGFSRILLGSVAETVVHRSSVPVVVVR